MTNKLTFSWVKFEQFSQVISPIIRTDLDNPFQWAAKDINRKVQIIFWHWSSLYMEKNLGGHPSPGPKLGLCIW